LGAGIATGSSIADGNVTGPGAASAIVASSSSLTSLGAARISRAR
jgi:hypothetical protein